MTAAANIDVLTHTSMVTKRELDIVFIFFLVDYIVLCIVTATLYNFSTFKIVRYKTFL